MILRSRGNLTNDVEGFRNGVNSDVEIYRCCNRTMLISEDDL